MGLRDVAKNIGKAIKKGVHDVGKVIPSPGALVGGAALGGLGSVVGSKVSGVDPIDDLKKGAALTPLALAGTSALGKSSGGGGVGTAAGDVAGNDDPSSDNAGELDAETEAAVSNAPGGKDLIDKFKAGLVGLSTVMDFAKKYAPVAVDLLAAKAAHDRQAQSDKYAQQGLALAQQHYAENAPIRDAGRSGMLTAGAYKPDLTKLQGLAGSGYTGPGSAPAPSAGTLPIAAGPPTPTPTPVGGGSRMPMPQTFGSQFGTGPASTLPTPPATTLPIGPPGIGAGGALTPRPTLPFAGGPPIVNRKPVLPFAVPQ